MPQSTKPGYPANIFANSVMTLEHGPSQFGDAYAHFDKLLRKQRASIETAQKAFEQKHAEAFIDDECSVVETLLGAAFLIGQTYISWLVSNVMRLHDHADKRGIVLETTNKTKAALMTVGSAPATWEKRDTGYTRIQVVDAFANYFKHRDEWPRRAKDPNEYPSWCNLRDDQRRTACIIKSVGAAEHSSGNMRQGACCLGFGEDVKILGKLLDGWRMGLVGRYKAELVEKGLINASG